jgi:hypothetical protein
MGVHQLRGQWVGVPVDASAGHEIEFKVVAVATDNISGKNLTYFQQILTGVRAEARYFEDFASAAHLDGLFIAGAFFPGFNSRQRVCIREFQEA